MSKVTVKVEGIADAIKNLKSYQLIKTQAVKDILKETGFKVEAQAKAACPVKTGRLRASISTNWAGSGKSRGRVGAKAEGEDGIGQPGGKEGLVVVVGTNVTYGPAVEYGHSVASGQGEGGFMGLGVGVSTFVQGKPFLTPAYLSYEGELEKRISAVLKKDVKV